MINKTFAPHNLLLVGVQQIDKNFFYNLKEYVEKNNYLKLNSKEFFKEVKHLFVFNGWQSFFNLKENYLDSYKDIFYQKEIVEAYRYVLLIMKKFENNKKFSAEEMIFLFFKELFFEESLKEKYKDHREGGCYFNTFIYKIRYFLRDISSEILLLSIFLKEIDFDFGSSGIKFKEIFSKYEKPIEKYLVEYEFDYEKYENMKIHNYCQLVKKRESEETVDMERYMSNPTDEECRFVRR